jgi:2-methylcitrate dehydratase
MTFQRDLAWQTLDYAYRASVANQYARYALTLNYDLLPPEVVHQAKRCLLDALGCAIGAFDASGRSICEALVDELGGPEEATVFGSGQRTSALNATLANSFLVRYLDYNDYGGGGHNSDSIPGIMAVCEREKASGRDLLTSMVISYELGARVDDSCPGYLWAGKGWTTDARGGLNMPPAVGKLLGLDEEQIANAIGICGSHAHPLNILDSNREENVMAKNLRFGWVVYDSILSCLLAKKGFTGPVRIVEGDSGMRQVMFQNEMDLEKMTDFSGWKILNTKYKSMCANGTTQGHVYATLAIVNENDLKPEDIASVQIKTCVRESIHTTTFSKRYPRNAESADHSAHYLNAIAIIERAITPEVYDPAKYTDPLVLDLIEKITVEGDTTAPVYSHHGISEITTKDGRHFYKRIEAPHGYGEVSLTDQELEDKFRQMAVKYMGDKQIKDLLDTIWNIDKFDEIIKLTGLMVLK